jgi:hypothetical protein
MVQGFFYSSYLLEEESRGISVVRALRRWWEEAGA